MPDVVTVAVTVPQLGDPRRRHWAKLVTGVDDNKTTGWAYLGEFVGDGGVCDLPVGGVVLLYGERGSAANPQPLAALYSVGGDRTMTLEAEASGRAWARTLRDRALELIDDRQQRGIDFAQMDSMVLAEELRARGWVVKPGSGAI